MEKPPTNRPAITLPDLLAVTGISMLGCGLWLISPSVSLCVLGVLFLGAGIFGQLTARREGGP